MEFSIMNEFIAAIDIGTTKVSTLIGRLKKDNVIEIKGYGLSKCKGLKKGLVIDINEATKSILDSVEMAEKSANMYIDSAHIGVTGKHIGFLSNFNEITISSPNKIIRKVDIDRLISLTNRVNIPASFEIIHTIIKQFIIDGEKGIEDPIGLATEKLGVELLVVYGGTSLIRNIANSVKAANIEIDDIILEALASAEAVLTNEEKESGVILLDIGGGTTDVAIYKNRKLVFTYCLPVGGDLVSNDISIGLNIPLLKAEDIKKRYANANYSFHESLNRNDMDNYNINRSKTTLNIQLYNIVNSRVKEMLILIKEKIDKFGFSNIVPCGLVITGGSSQIRGLLSVAGNVFNMPARIGIPIDIEGPLEVINNPACSTAAGLLKYSLYGGNNDDFENSSHTSGNNASMMKKFKKFILKILKSER